MKGLTRIINASRSVASAAPVLLQSGNVERYLQLAAAASQRGYFKPGEDEELRVLFGHYLYARRALHETISELRPLAYDEEQFGREQSLMAFLVAYTAAAVLVKAGNMMVENVAGNRLLRRKLDEAEPRFGIRRKQFTRIYVSLKRIANVYALHQARKFAENHRNELLEIAEHYDLGPLKELLKESEEALSIGPRAYVKRRIRYRFYSFRRRRQEMARRTIFAFFEISGRIIAEFRNVHKQVTPRIVKSCSDKLRPGDILITRHKYAASNMFLPGFWPHAALYIGTAQERRDLDLRVDSERTGRWIDDICVLEARKDGVLFRALADTLTVDYFVIIRPQLEKNQLRDVLSRAVSHEGKLYDFDFNFCTADRLVCTELIYRSFDGIGSLSFELKPRSGRMTLSAEDLLHRALSGEGFSVEGIFGTEEAEKDVLAGEQCLRILKRTLEN